VVYSPFLEKEKNKEELKEELDSLEIQLFRMQNNIKEIAKKSDIVSIDQTKEENWVVIYTNMDKDSFQIMLHDCSKPYRGKWDSAIQAEYKDEQTIHIADIKGLENKGYGSVLMKHLKEVAKDQNIPYITGDIVERDADHFDRLSYFYQKHSFDVKIDYDNLTGKIVWNDL